MKLYTYRFFLNRTSQQSLFPEVKTKPELLKEVLSDKYQFSHGKSELGYVVEKTVGNYIYAKMGKRSSLNLSQSPEQGFQDKKIEHWPNCSIFINLDDNPSTGQKIFFEYNRSIFETPLIQLQKLSEEINGALLTSGYVMTVSPVTDQQDFWKVVNENNGEIKELTMNFVAPNLFNLKNKLEDDLRDVHQEYGATHASLSLKNEQTSLSLNPNSPLIKQGLEYITKGGGQYKLRIKNTIYSSEDKVRSVIEASLNPDELDDGQLKLILDKLFGRDV